MDRQKIRIIQFSINAILTFLTYVSGILGYLLFIPLALTALVSFFIHNWSFFWQFSIFVIILLAIAFCSETLNFKLPEMFGKFFDEDKEDKKIYQEYENWFNEWCQKEYEKYEHARQEQQNQGYGAYHSVEDIIEKFEENLKILGLEANSQLSLQNIKKAHRTKAKELHPDKNPGKDTTADMQKVNAAKEYLDANLEYYLSKKFQNKK